MVHKERFFFLKLGGVRSILFFTFLGHINHSKKWYNNIEGNILHGQFFFLIMYV